MSRHYWNTCSERAHLDRMMNLSLNLLAEHQTREELSEDLHSDNNDVLSVGFLDSSLSLNSLTSVDSMDSFLSLESRMSIDSMDSALSLNSFGCNQLWLQST